MSIQYFKYNKPFRLESGAELPELTIAYHTFGTYDGCNAIWVCHALTANSDVADWWPHTVERGRFLDPERYFTVCANILGSHYGTTGPLTIDPRSGEPYYSDFPMVTVRDMANAHFLLAEHLGLDSVLAIMGSSIGGFQAMEMALLRPGFAQKLALIATAATSQPWATAFNQAQRMAIEADGTFGQRSPDAGKQGMKAARAIGLLSYRGAAAYNATQQECDDIYKVCDFRASSYQQYQGDKLARRFDAYSYWSISRAFDSHNVGRGRGSVEQALASLTGQVLVVGISSDLILPVSEQIFLFRHIPHASIEIISSEFGHDGFLVEHDKLNSILMRLLSDSRADLE